MISALALPSVYERKSVVLALQRIPTQSHVLRRALERREGHKAARRAYRLYKPDSSLKTCIEYDESGAPYFGNDAGSFLSISHSNDFVVATVAPFAVGVDLEFVCARNSRMLDYVASEEEQSYVPTSTLDERLTIVWTVKEAVMKGARKGLAWSPRALTIQSAESAKEGMYFRVRDPENTLWQVVCMQPIREYMLSIATHLS